MRTGQRPPGRWHVRIARAVTSLLEVVRQFCVSSQVVRQWLQKIFSTVYPPVSLDYSEAWEALRCKQFDMQEVEPPRSFKPSRQKNGPRGIF